MEYYYAEGEVQKGPFSLGDLARQGLKPGMLVWRDGMSEWQRAEALPELQALFAAPAEAAQPVYPMGADARIDAIPGTAEVPLAPAPAPAYSTVVTQPYPAAQQPYGAAQQQPAYAPYPAAAGPYPTYPGQQPLGYAGYSTGATQPPSGLAMASMILGIVAIPTSCMYGIGLPCAILAVIFGHVARGKARRGEAGGDGMALAGLICGYIMLALIVIGVIFVVIAIASAGAGSRSRGW